MGYCSVRGCKSRNENVRVFRFPKDEERRFKWAKICGRSNWWPNDSARICELHFSAHQFENHRLDGLKKLRPFAIPEIQDPTDRTDLDPTDLDPLETSFVETKFKVIPSLSPHTIFESALKNSGTIPTYDDGFQEELVCTPSIYSQNREMNDDQGQGTNEGSATNPEDSSSPGSSKVTDKSKISRQKDLNVSIMWETVSNICNMTASEAFLDIMLREDIKNMLKKVDAPMGLFTAVAQEMRLKGYEVSRNQVWMKWKHWETQYLDYTDLLDNGEDNPPIIKPEFFDELDDILRESYAKANSHKRVKRSLLGSGETSDDSEPPKKRKVGRPPRNRSAVKSPIPLTQSYSTRPQRRLRPSYFDEKIVYPDNDRVMQEVMTYIEQQVARDQEHEKFRMDVYNMFDKWKKIEDERGQSNRKLLEKMKELIQEVKISRTSIMEEMRVTREYITLLHEGKKVDVTSLRMPIELTIEVPEEEIDSIVSLSNNEDAEDFVNHINLENGLRSLKHKNEKP